MPGPRPRNTTKTSVECPLCNENTGFSLPCGGYNGKLGIGEWIICERCGEKLVTIAVDRRTGGLIKHKAYAEKAA